MLCLKCGEEIDNRAAFCPHCGAPTGGGQPEAPAAPEAPSYSAPYTAASPAWSDPGQAGKKPRRGPIIAVAAVVAVIVVALAAVALSRLFSSPKGQVEAAFGKTAAAYAEAGKRVGLPDLDELVQSRAYSQRLRMEFQRINGAYMDEPELSALEGLGLRLNADLDQKHRKLDFEMAAYLNGKDFATLQMLADDDVMSFSIPQIMGNEALGFNTETLGADLKRMGAEENDSMDLDDLSFNLFELIDAVAPSGEQYEEQAQTMEEAAKRLFDEAQVKKAGEETVNVNGAQTKATLYHVTVSQESLADYVDALGDVLASMSSPDAMRDMLLAMGMDRGDVEQMLEEMGDVEAVYDEMTDAMKDALAMLGDVELDVYVSGGYVCAVKCVLEVQGSELEMGLYLGGGDEYVDDLSLEFTVEGTTIVLQSSGDHGAKSGTFTDETALRVSSGFASAAMLTSKLRYEPKGGSDNLSWSLGMAGTASLDLRGTLTAKKDSLELLVDDFSVTAMGTELLSIGLEYYLGPCAGMSVSHPTVVMLTDMDEAKAQAMAERYEANTEAWVLELESLFPASLTA